MLLALIVWIGGIIFFAFIEAPTLFRVLPTTKLAGDVVSVSLTRLHWMGLFSGTIFLLCSVTYQQLKHAQVKLFALSHIFILLMLALTALSQFSIAPRMRELRTEAQNTNTQPSANAEFNRLHAWSTRLEGAVLLLGIGVVIMVARQPDSSH